MSLFLKLCFFLQNTIMFFCESIKNNDGFHKALNIGPFKWIFLIWRYIPTLCCFLTLEHHGKCISLRTT